MNFVVIEEQQFNQLLIEVAEIKELLKIKNEVDLKEQWIPSESARNILGVCRKTWQDYRDKKIIPFSQFGRKIYIKKADLEAFMLKNYIKQ